MSPHSLNLETERHHAEQPSAPLSPDAKSNAFRDAVRMAKPQLHSSHLKTWRQCARKFWWDYLVQIPQEPDSARDFGSRVHAILERMAKFREPLPYTAWPREAACADALGSLVPFRLDDPRVSSEIAWTVADRLWDWAGTIDVFFCADSGEGLSIIGDYKTTSDIDQWALTEDELRLDPQSVLYSHQFFAKNPEQPAVMLQWYNAERAAPKHRKRVQVEMSQADAFLGMLHLAEDAHSVFWAIMRSREMATEVRAEFCAGCQGDYESERASIEGRPMPALPAPHTCFSPESDTEEIKASIDEKMVASILGMPYTTHGCTMYGGCPHVDRCNLKPSELIELGLRKRA